MTELTDQIRHRVLTSLAALERAREAGDDYSVQVHTGELESFAVIARANDVELHELDRFRSAS